MTTSLNLLFFVTVHQSKLGTVNWSNWKGLMAPSLYARSLVFGYWFRVLIRSDISVEDIAKITLEFGNEYEIFDGSLSHQNINITNGELAFKALMLQRTGDKSVFGTVVAVLGRKYHWKLKVIGDEVDDINIGIIEADKCELNKNGFWWNKCGISYYSCNGHIYKYNEETELSTNYEYGKPFKNEKNVMIDIWLDLKDKNELSFAKNDEKFGKAANVKNSMKYRLAVSIWDSDTKIQILSFDIEF